MSDQSSKPRPYLYQIPGRLLEMVCEEFELTQIKLVKSYGDDWAIYGTEISYCDPFLAFNHTNTKSILVLSYAASREIMDDNEWKIDSIGYANELLTVRAKLHSTGAWMHGHGNELKEQLSIKFGSRAMECSHTAIAMCGYLASISHELAFKCKATEEGRKFWEVDLWPDRDYSKEGPFLG